MSLYEIQAKRIDGVERDLSEFRGKVLLIVNVASRCGFTGQYAGLEKLYRTYADRGLVVLGFPCNQFAGQEPGDNEEIRSFCSLKYDVSFPMFAKVDVNGESTHPLYEWLKSEKPGMLGLQRIGWNFTKFLVDRNGNVVGRYAPTTTPEALAKFIEPLLDAKSESA
jgi:glutathione peroxidase